MPNDIDFVIMWVDGNDPEWKAEKEKFQIKKSGDNRSIRFRYWDNLHFWFRGVEKYTPWVNKIHFVTWGHISEWLNKKHPKLSIVKHSDFLDSNDLPVFNSRAIEINLHKIPNLSEKFVYFNDDMFITRPVTPEDFFKKGLPRDVAIPNPCPSNSRLGIGCAISNNMEIINTTFNKRKSIKQNFTKWFNPLYKKHVIASICMLPWKDFASFLSTHIPHSYLKSTFEEVWKQEEDILKETSSSKFRNKNNVNQWLMRYWQLASGNFMPRNISDGKNFMLKDDNIDAIKSIKNQTYKLICLNDTIDISEFDYVKKDIQNAFHSIFPNKSEFEI